MPISPFHAYYTARKLESLSDDDRFISVFASSNINVYPFQIAAANFALRSPYQKGVILCDEAGMGKSHEAMLVVTQKWYEGKNRILFAIPNADLLLQWVELIEQHYTIPYVVLASREDWQNNVNEETPNAFLQDAIIITTYDFLADQQTAAQAVKWDITVFEEANALSSVYEDEKGVKAKALKEIADGSFKILLTGTPIEKNIMDLYGLIYFIDETILPDEQSFLQRYFRKPQNYPELAERVSKYCFRTLRSQAKQYSKIPERVLVTYEYTPSKKERELYDLLYAYIEKSNKIAFPEMNAYDLAVNTLLSPQSSSTVAILQTLRGIVKRLKTTPNSADEIAEFECMIQLAESIEIDEKAKQLLLALNKVFPILKKNGANKKAIIFTESVETQKYLYTLLKNKYKTLLYGGSADYSAIKDFKADGEILISTDIGAKGFNLEECSFIINYDLLFNTLKMEQRIDRCHRLNQQNDVITLAFIDPNNASDVRKLQLVNKRTLVSDGVFGVSDFVIGGFTDNLDKALNDLVFRARTKAQIESEYQQTLTANEEENKQFVSSAEDILFTTFTKQLAGKIKITPQYAYEKSKEMNEQLWQLVKFFFEKYNANNTDCCFEIDDVNQTVTATNYIELPFLFYYWSNGGSRKYKSQKSYGMAQDFKPHHGRITLSSIIGRGIIHNLECADDGNLTVEADIEPCSIALYSVGIKPTNKGYSVLVGKAESGKILTDQECKKILSSPVTSFTESEHKSAHWLRKSTGRSNSNALDRYVNTDELLAKETEQLSPTQAEEVDRIKLRAKNNKSVIGHAIDDLEGQVGVAEQEMQSADGDRMKTLTLTRTLRQLQQEFRQKQENLFFEEMQLDLETEKKIEEFLGKEKLTAKVDREFVINVENTGIAESS